MKKYTNIEIAATVLLIIGLIVLFVFPFIKPYAGTFTIDQEKAADFGTFIGGYIGTIFMLISVFILILTLSSQKTSNQVHQFESKLIGLLQLHKENVLETKIEEKTKRTVFVILRAEFQDIYDIAKKHFVNYEKQDLAQISYTILYFGIGDTSTPMIKSVLENFDSNKVYALIKEIDTHRKKRGYKDKELTHLKKFEIGDYYPFNGHQSRLGHYYRNIYQIIKFIDKQKYLLDADKKDYAKMLRAQMSNHELAIFFYNSLSPLGKEWTLRKTTLNGKKVSFIEKYEFIKNIPLNGFTYELNPEDFYKQDYEMKKVKAQLLTKNIVHLADSAKNEANSNKET